MRQTMRGRERQTEMCLWRKRWEAKNVENQKCVVWWKVTGKKGFQNGISELPWWLRVVESLPPNAEDMGSIPDSGRSHAAWSSKAHAPQLLSQHSRAHMLQLLKPVYLEPSSTRREATKIRCPCPAMKSSSRSLQLEKSLLSNEDPAQPKIN